jgi:hypothetical protein
MADSVAEAFEEGEKVTRHPVAVLFHLLFRVTALVVYLTANILRFTTNISETGVMVSVILLLAFDFWVVKNVTGRLLAGLRWWNKVEEDGSSKWVFEWRKSKKKVPASETYIFWIALIVCPVLWAVFIFTSFTHFSVTWTMLAVTGFILNGANVYGYVMCRRDAQDKFASMATKYIGKKVIEKTLTPSE